MSRPASGRLPLQCVDDAMLYVLAKDSDRDCEAIAAVRELARSTFLVDRNGMVT